MNEAARLLSRDRQSSIDDIATAAGVSRTTFYRAFPSRAELLQALEVQPEPDTRQRVLDASIRLLRTKTLRDLSVDELASEAGVSRANLYRLFPGKAALFRAILLTYSPFEPVMAEFVTGSISAPGLFEAAEYLVSKSDPLRAIYLYEPSTNHELKPAINFSIMNGVRASLALQRDG